MLGINCCRAVVCCIVPFFLLAGCTGTNQGTINTVVEKNKVHSEKRAEQPLARQWKLPIKAPEGEIFKISGWASNDDFIYIANTVSGSNVYEYNLPTGKSSLLYKSDFPVAAVQVSPDKKYFLIQSSPSSFEGKLAIIDKTGHEIWSKSIPSFELQFEWNPYNTSEIIISAFKEDWSFNTYLLNLEKQEFKELSLPQPFVKWNHRNSFVYLNWDNNSQQLFAPLISQQLGSLEAATLFPKVFHFSAFKDRLLTISLKDNNTKNAIYSFYDSNLTEILTFSMPQLAKFSGWLVPFYDYNEKTNQFITLKPLKSGEADTYNEGFQLVSYQLEKQETNGKVIIDRLENAPINCSPEGNYCLYGNRFEKVIDLNSKKIYSIISE